MRIGRVRSSESCAGLPHSHRHEPSIRPVWGVAPDAFELGSRDRLDEGLLHVYVAEGLLPSGWSDLSPRTEMAIESASPRLRVALDGEPAELVTPLRFTIEPGALRVLVPPAPPEAGERAGD